MPEPLTIDEVLDNREKLYGTEICVGGYYCHSVKWTWLFTHRSESSEQWRRSIYLGGRELRYLTADAIGLYVGSGLVQFCRATVDGVLVPCDADTFAVQSRPPVQLRPINRLALHRRDGSDVTFTAEQIRAAES